MVFPNTKSLSSVFFSTNSWWQNLNPSGVVVINTLGRVGDKDEEWTLKGAWVQAANFGELSFENATPPLEVIFISIPSKLTTFLLIFLINFLQNSTA